MAVAIQPANLRTINKQGVKVYVFALCATEKEGALTGFWCIGIDEKENQVKKYRLEELEGDI